MIYKMTIREIYARFVTGYIRMKITFRHDTVRYKCFAKRRRFCCYICNECADWVFNFRFTRELRIFA